MMVLVEEVFDAFKVGVCSVIDVRDVKLFWCESILGVLNIFFVNIEGKLFVYMYMINV